MEPAAHDDEWLTEPPELQANTKAPKTIGTLNIVFGSLMFLCGLCSSLNLMTQATMGPMMAAQQQQMQQALQAERKQELQELRRREEASNDENEKAELRAQQQALARPMPKMPDMSKVFQDANFLIYGIADAVTGLLLNILLVISGIGLCGLKEWGRALALWVAALKIVRLIAVYGFLALVVVPIVVRQFTAMFQEMFEEMAKAGPPGQRMPAQAELNQLGTIMGATMTIFAVGMIVLGVIYPIIVLIVLTRPRVKAALR